MRWRISARSPPIAQSSTCVCRDMSGLDVLRAARERLPDLKAIVITAHGDVDSAVAALRLGAFDFIRKPFDLEEVVASVKNALRTDELERQVAYLSGAGLRDRVHQRDHGSHHAAHRKSGRPAGAGGR